jgi:galactofuranose transport system ATP-binding protein
MAPTPIVRMTGITKRFPGVRALSDVDFQLYPGEVHALMGENGAGKSTLIKVLTGVHGHDAGTIELAGAPVAFDGPGAARAAGISTVYQEVNLCPNLSVAENVTLGSEPRRFGRIRWGAVRQRARDLLDRLELDTDVTATLSSCSLAVQQMVAIARALDVESRVLVLDEPTSSLDAGEVEQLFRVIRRLRAEGIAILFVSHFLDQVYAVADRITVLRNGTLVGEYPAAELPQVELVQKMLGAEAGALERLEHQGRPAAAVAETPVVAAAEGLGRKGDIEPFTLTIHEGEVLGLAGLLGSGRTELVRLLAGADRATAGRLELAGRPVTLRSPRAAIDLGVAYSSEDRKAEGLVPDLTVRENIVLALQAARGWSRPLPRRRQNELVEKYVTALRITPPDPEMRAGNLSGGNQQKLLLARWLITEPKLLVLDEPTRGIDVGAKAEIQRLVVELADGGMAVLFVSAELEEVLRLSHRIAVLRDRRLVEELVNGPDVDSDRVMAAIAAGGAR